MIPYERKNKIIQLLKSNDLLKIESIKTVFPNISISTIRRDLKKLENENKIKLLSGGGIKLSSSIKEISISTKRMLNTEKKEYIAKLAINKIKNGDTIYIDSGSTCLILLEQIKKEKLDINIITTNTDALSISKDATYHLTLLGGYYSPLLSSLKGPLTEQNIKNFYFDVAFLGANAIHPLFGITTPTLEEANKKQLVFKNSKKVYFLCDSHKFHEISTIKAFELNNNSIISDKNDNQISKIANLIYQ